MANANWSDGRRGKRVLIVDDDQDYAGSITAYIRMEGYYANHVPNGRAALNWINRHGHPDVILLDIQMPVMNGVEFMRAYTGSALIIVGTAWEDEELPFEPFEKLAKPFKPNRLFEVIEKALEAKGETGWKRYLPCRHTCVTLEIKNDHLVFTCMIPGCEKRSAVHKETLSFETVLALTIHIAQEQIEKEDITSLS